MNLSILIDPLAIRIDQVSIRCLSAHIKTALTVGAWFKIVAPSIDPLPASYHTPLKSITYIIQEVPMSIRRMEPSCYHPSS